MTQQERQEAAILFAVNQPAALPHDAKPVAMIVIMAGHPPMLLAVRVGSDFAARIGCASLADPEGPRRDAYAAEAARQIGNYDGIYLYSGTRYARRAKPCDLADVAYEHGWINLTNRPPVSAA